jgi:hypothetical protein
MPKLTKKMFLVSMTPILAMLFLAAGLTAVSAQAFRPRSEVRQKACQTKFDECVKSCKGKGCEQSKCDPDLIACSEAAETDEEKAAAKARDEKETVEQQKAAAAAAKFDCAGRGSEMVMYGTNKTYKTLTCEVLCQYTGGNNKTGHLGCKSITVGPNLTKKEVCAHSSVSEPPPPFKVTGVTSLCH